MMYKPVISNFLGHETMENDADQMPRQCRYEETYLEGVGDNDIAR